MRQLWTHAERPRPRHHVEMRAHHQLQWLWLCRLSVLCTFLNGAMTTLRTQLTSCLLKEQLATISSRDQESIAEASSSTGPVHTRISAQCWFAFKSLHCAMQGMSFGNKEQNWQDKEGVRSRVIRAALEVTGPLRHGRNHVQGNLLRNSLACHAASTLADQTTIR